MADNKLNGKPCSLLQLRFDSPDFLKRKLMGKNADKKAQTANCLGFGVTWNADACRFGQVVDRNLVALGSRVQRISCIHGRKGTADQGRSK